MCTINLGSFNVCIEGLQVIISMMYFFLRRSVSVNIDKMLRNVAFHQNIHRLKKYALRSHKCTKD